MNTEIVQRLAQSLSKQLPYKRMNISENTLITPLSSQIPKIPNYQSLELEDGTDIEYDELIPSVGNDSFLHCIVMAVYPAYSGMSWSGKVSLVSKVREYLLYHAKDHQGTRTGLNSKRLVPSSTKCFVADRFNINIITMDSTDVTLFCGKTYLPYNTTIILYETDDGLYYVLPNSGKMYHCLSESAVLKAFYPKLKDCPHLLESETAAPKHSASTKSSKSKYSKHSLSELQDICVNYGILIKKESSNGKLVNCKKSELIEALSSY